MINYCFHNNIFHIYFSTNNEICLCRKCNQIWRNQWFYTLSLSANLLWLFSKDLNSTNYNEVRKLEEHPIVECNRETPECWKYITETWIYSGVNGLQLLDAFKNGSLDKRLYMTERIIDYKDMCIFHITNRKQILEENYKYACSLINDAYQHIIPMA